MRSDYISEIDESGKGHWWPGVFAIENVVTGRRHYVGTQNVGRRVRDNIQRLNFGNHPNPDLQADWVRSASHFRVLLVDRVIAQPMIRIKKQAWLDKDRDERAAGVYNRKNALPYAARTSAPTSQPRTSR